MRSRQASARAAMPASRICLAKRARHLPMAGQEGIVPIQGVHAAGGRHACEVRRQVLTNARQDRPRPLVTRVQNSDRAQVHRESKVFVGRLLIASSLLEPRRQGFRNAPQTVRVGLLRRGQLQVLRRSDDPKRIASHEVHRAERRIDERIADIVNVIGTPADANNFSRARRFTCSTRLTVWILYEAEDEAQEAARPSALARLPPDGHGSESSAINSSVWEQPFPVPDLMVSCSLYDTLLERRPRGNLGPA